MAHGTPQQVGFRQTETRQLMSYAQHLLLVENDPIRLFQQGLQAGMQMLDRLQAFEAAHEGVLQPAAERARPVKRQGCHDVIRSAGMDLAQSGAHAGAFDLEAADRPATFDPVGGLRVIRRSRFQHTQRTRIFTWPVSMDEFGHIPQHGQSAYSQQVDLDQPELLDRIQVELGDGDSFAARAHDRYQVGQRAGCHHHASRMHGQMARQLEQRFGLVEDTPVGR